jgi:tRNA threonylcarbamoyladenosine biosynthesis protein TsaE
MRIHLPDPDATLALGRRLAECLVRERIRPAVLLNGDLGAGKTTLIRGLVPNLPGGTEAEVSSPSFNIVNLYPTNPATAHFDLYRLEGAGLEGDLEEQLHDPDLLRLVEWAEHLPAADRPDDMVSVTWEPCPEGRTVILQARGEQARRLLTCLESLPDFPAPITHGRY